MIWKVYGYTSGSLNSVLYLSVLSCEPFLSETKGLIHELNNTNDLFKFVRVMRKKFQEAVAQGTTMVLSFFYTSAVMILESSVCCQMNLAFRLQIKFIGPLYRMIIFWKLKPWLLNTMWTRVICPTNKPWPLLLSLSIAIVVDMATNVWRKDLTWKSYIVIRKDWSIYICDDLLSLHLF